VISRAKFQAEGREPAAAYITLGGCRVKVLKGRAEMKRLAIFALMLVLGLIIASGEI